MRRWATILLLVAMTPMMRAERPLNIEQLEQLLTALHGQSDRKAARQLLGLRLTERATSARLARWEGNFPGKHCREALTELADASTFLDPPSSDIAADPPPVMASQQDMLLKAIDATLSIVHRLPNFYATRLTERFEDTPPSATLMRGNVAAGGRGGRSGIVPSTTPATTPEESAYTPLHRASTTRITVRYYEGHEMQDNKIVDFDTTRPSPSGLTTSGEFGPILAMGLTDAVENTIQWARWEKDAQDVRGVFRYRVPANKSHFLVALPEGGQIERIMPSYHGEVEIDPVSGNVLRISLIAELEPPNQKVVSAIQVEYGTVNIGGQDYLCPIKSVALSKMPIRRNGQDAQGPHAPLRTELNDVKFTDYHLFRSEARIVTNIPDENAATKQK